MLKILHTASLVCSSSPWWQSTVVNWWGWEGVRRPVLSTVVLGDSSFLFGSRISIHLMKSATDRFWSRLFFQGCLYCEHPGKTEMENPSGAEGRFVWLSSTVMVMSPSGAGLLAAYKEWDFPCLGFLSWGTDPLCVLYPPGLVHVPSLGLRGQRELTWTWSSCCLLCWE